MRDLLQQCTEALAPLPEPLPRERRGNGSTCPSLSARALPLVQTRDGRRALRARGNERGSIVIALKDKKARAIFDAAGPLASAAVPVLILGEPGSGRGVLAQRIHQLGVGALRPWHIVECSSLGDLRLTENVPRATLFLRNIDFIRRDLQRPLAAILAEHGGDWRILASGPPDLRSLSDDGRFCRDLYGVLASVELHIPPLRERPADIPELVAAFLACSGWCSDDADRFADEAMEYLLSYDWPGNVAELEHVIARLAQRKGPRALSADDLPPQIRWFPGNSSDWRIPPLQGKPGFNPLSEDFQIQLIADAMRRTRHL